jgi:plasmid stabilization system protein ParE
MQIIRDDKYISRLESVLDFIAQDSINKAHNFLNRLDYKINNIFNMPYKYGKSLYYDSDDTRDLIFKGYTIPYLIDNNKNKIIILDIFKWVDK